jgi:hypothetical protein
MARVSPSGSDDNAIYYLPVIKILFMLTRKVIIMIYTSLCHHDYQFYFYGNSTGYITMFWSIRKTEIYPIYVLRYKR